METVWNVQEICVWCYEFSPYRCSSVKPAEGTDPIIGAQVSICPTAVKRVRVDFN